MTDLDTIVQRSRQVHHNLGTALQARAEVVVRQHMLFFVKEADDAAAGTATLERPILRVPGYMAGGIQIVAIQFVPRVAITADAANNATFTFAKRDGAGGGPTTVCTRTTDVAGGSMSAMQFGDITIATTEADRQLPAGAILTLAITKAAAGVVVPSGCFNVYYKEL
jgi:hypothetical protein